MNGQEIREEEKAAERWAECLDEVHAHIAGRFARSEQRQRARAYLQGLLSPIERKNGWQLAEAAGEANPYGYQELLSRAHWDAEAVRDDLLDLVRGKLADQAAVVVIDETGFLKKGTKSVGVAPQYSGTAGKISNCQIGVFLAYAAQQGQVLMDRELYLPREWTDDPQRCEEAGVPQEVTFATKLVLARRMLERVLAHHLPFAWVTADSVYGADYHLRRFLTERHIPYVLAVAPNHLVRLGWKEGFEAIRVDEWLARKKSQVRWHRLSAGWGSKGPRWFDWTWWKMDAEVPDGWQAWIVVRRSISNPTEMVFHRVCASKETTLQQIVDIAGARWKVEDAIERGKGECGLDQYEVRSWTGWYRHITLSLVAQFCATLMMDQANAEQEKKAWSRTQVRAVCTASSAGEDWPSVDPLHLARSASLDLAAGLSAGDHARSHPGLVVVSASSSGCGSSLSLQTAVSSQSILTPTVVLGIKVQLAGIGQVISLSLEHSLPMKPG